MSLLTKKHIMATVDIDGLLQDSYLLVVELRQGKCVLSSKALTELCSKQIEHVRLHLKNAGLSRRSIDHISHAQCALLDETVLSCTETVVHADWAGEPLQAKFFGRHQAGESLYEDMREVLREPSPDVYVLTAFQRLLVLGFQGRYREINDPQRAQLLAELTSRVPPMALSQCLPTQVNTRRRFNPLRWLRSPVAQIAVVSLLLVSVWLGLDHLLGEWIVTPLAGEA